MVRAKLIYTFLFNKLQAVFTSRVFCSSVLCSTVPIRCNGRVTQVLTKIAQILVGATRAAVWADLVCAVCRHGLCVVSGGFQILWNVVSKIPTNPCHRVCVCVCILKHLLTSETEVCSFKWSDEYRRLEFRIAGLIARQWQLMRSILINGCVAQVWQATDTAARQSALKLYAVNLVMNLSWQLIFFKAKLLGFAQLENLALLVVAAYTMKAFYRVRPMYCCPPSEALITCNLNQRNSAAELCCDEQVKHLAGNLLLPYVVFVAFANLLNFSIWRQNPNAGA